MDATVNARLEVRPIASLGFDQTQAVLTDADTGKALVSVIRWSESMARRDAYAWAQRNGIKII